MLKACKCIYVNPYLAACQMQLGQEEHGRDHMDAEEDGYTIRPVQLGAESPDDQYDR